MQSLRASFGPRGRREGIKVLRLLEDFPENQVTAAVPEGGLAPDLQEGGELDRRSFIHSNGLFGVDVDGGSIVTAIQRVCALAFRQALHPRFGCLHVSQAAASSGAVMSTWRGQTARRIDRLDPQRYCLKEDIMLATTFDFTPLFRTSVGFDRMSRLLDSAARLEDNALSYPPYDIERVGDHKYGITMALAGYGEKDLELTVHEGTLTVKTRPHDAGGGKDRKFLHRGIGGRAFERKFQLAEYVEVVGAKLENGLLRVDLERIVPEEKRPRTIDIGGPKQIESKVASAWRGRG